MSARLAASTKKIVAKPNANTGKMPAERNASTRRIAVKLDWTVDGDRPSRFETRQTPHARGDDRRRVSDVAFRAHPVKPGNNAPENRHVRGSQVPPPLMPGG